MNIHDKTWRAEWKTILDRSDVLLFVSLSKFLLRISLPTAYIKMNIRNTTAGEEMHNSVMSTVSK